MDQFCAILSNPFSALAIIGTSFEFKQELIGTSTGQNWNIFKLYKPSLHPCKMIKMRNLCVVNDSTENKSPEGQQEPIYMTKSAHGLASTGQIGALALVQTIYPGTVVPPRELAIRDFGKPVLIFYYTRPSIFLFSNFFMSQVFGFHLFFSK